MRVLMLHGYTQCGRLFQIKLRRLEERLRLEYTGIQCIYPCGSLSLDPLDKLGKLPNDPAADDSYDEAKPAGNAPFTNEAEMYSWFDHHDSSWPPRGLQQSFDVLAETCRAHGPFDGIIAFSQGTAMAAMMAAILADPVRGAASFDKVKLRYPATFARLRPCPVKFVVFYGPAISPRPQSISIYTPPPQDTRFCHVMGSFDPVVDLTATNHTLDTFPNSDGSPEIIRHPGGHFPPMSTTYVEQVASFIEKASIGQSVQIGQHLSLIPSSKELSLPPRPRPLAKSSRFRRPSRTPFQYLKALPQDQASHKVLNACPSCRQTLPPAWPDSRPAEHDHFPDMPDLGQWSGSTRTSISTTPESKASMDLIDLSYTLEELDDLRLLPQ